MVYYKAQHGFSVYGYCFLPDKIQLVIQPGPRADISRIMKDIWGNFSRRVNIRWQRRGPILRSKYIKVELADPTEIHRAIMKVHHQVAEAGLSEPACGSPYSSATNYRRGLGDLMVDVYRVPEETWPVPQRAA